MIKVTGRIFRLDGVAPNNRVQEVNKSKFLAAVGSDMPAVYRFLCLEDSNSEKSGVSQTIYQHDGQQVDLYNTYGVQTRVGMNPPNVYTWTHTAGDIVEITVENTMDPTWEFTVKAYNEDGASPDVTVLRAKTDDNGIRWLTKSGLLREGAHRFYYDPDAEYNIDTSSGISLVHGGYRLNREGILLPDLWVKRTLNYNTGIYLTSGRIGDVVEVSVKCTAPQMTDPRKHRMTYGLHDALLEDGRILRDVASKLIYVNSETELPDLHEELPGTFAMLYGLGKMWQKKPDGSWTEI